MGPSGWLRRWSTAVLVAAAVGMTPGAAAAELDACKLLTAAEVEEVIGPHTPSALGASCEWNATAPVKKGSEFYARITVHVFAGNKLAWAKQQVRGEPVEGVAKNAKWDRMSGEMWFDCAGGRVCELIVSASSGQQRLAAAKKLAVLVDSRLH